MKTSRLVELAKEHLPRAYAPYSGYGVAASLLTAKGNVFTGVNVENASLGLTICAERAAVIAAITAGECQFTRLAVVAGGESPPLPCGACRQVLHEFAPTIDIIVVSPGKENQTYNLAELLPHSFSF